MNKKLGILLTALFSLTLGACNTPTTSSSSSSTAPSVPTPPENHEVLDLDLGEAPTYEGDSFMFHYWRKNGKYTGWDMWIWEENGNGAAFEFNGKDDWGVVAAYPFSMFNDLTANKLGFLFRRGGDSWAEKDCGGNDIYVDFNEYEKDENGVYHIYMISGDSNVYINENKDMKGVIRLAAFSKVDRVVISTNLKITDYEITCDGEIIASGKGSGTNRVDVTLDNPLNFTSSYVGKVTLVNGDVISAKISKTLIYDTPEFANEYTYEGDDLGAYYDAKTNKTTFKVWSPVSSKITLNVYETGTPKALGGSDEKLTYDLTKGEKGVWSYVVDGNLNGKYYTYSVTNGEYVNREVVDPYARSAGVNGVRGMVVDFSSTNPVGWETVAPHQYDRKELTIYETHVADVSSSSTWGGTPANAKLFKGMYEENTTYTSGGVTVSTGFDHIKELGVNAVQIIPFFDQANDEIDMTFNWGYNPLNYNVVEGGYSSNPHDGYTRIKELKELIMAYNKAGINIIMDVVYNHTNGALGSNFDILMPGYYYRYNAALGLSNGSGCGNEIASEKAMVRKFIIDSVKFWAEEYKLGGYRFDLMGLHDLETMNLLTAELKKINPSICVFGEPWNGGTSPLADSKSAKQINGNKYEGYGAFNDKIRDGMIKGGLAGVRETGWITQTTGVNRGDLTAITKGIQGITYAATPIEDPDKTINYVTCHDNYTLHDRFVKTGLYNDEQHLDQMKKMNVLANSIVFTSNGTSFMLAGEEMLRSKPYTNEEGQTDLSGNSYNLSYETNEIDYSLKIKHADMFENYKKMIAFKQDVTGLHLSKERMNEISPAVSTSGSRISYTVVDETTNREYLIIHVNGVGDETKYDLTGYTYYHSTVDANKVISSETVIEQYETLIVYKNL